MGKVVIDLTDTTLKPISTIGKYAGKCYGADTSNEEKNYRRGMDCIVNNHGRTIEFPDVYMTISGFSARVVREFYTHIGGAPTRLQESTRYINESGFNYIMPKSIEKNLDAKIAYEETMDIIKNAYSYLLEVGIPKEDIANILPLGMESSFVCKINLRTLISMSNQRLCARALWEFRDLMREIMKELSSISEEWKFIVDNYFVPKCEVNGINKCLESKGGCGRFGNE